LGQQLDLDLDYNSKRPLRTIIKMLDLKIHIFLSYFVLFFIKFSPELLTPVYLKEVISFADRSNNKSVSYFIIVNVVFAIICIQNVFTHSIFTKLVHGRVRRLEKLLRSSLVRKLQQLSIGYYTNTQTGKLQSKVLRDVEDITNLLIQIFHQGYSLIFSVGWCMIITFTSDWIVGVFFIISAPLTALIIHLFKGKMDRNNERYRKSMEKMSSRVSEMINSIPITRAHGVEQQEIDKTQEDLDRVYDASVKLDFTNQVFGASSWVLMKLAIICIMFFSGILVFKGRMEVENMILYYGLFQIIVGTLTSAMNFTPIFTRGFQAFKSLGEVLESPDLEYNVGKKKLNHCLGAVSFNNIHFFYNSDEIKVLAGFSADIKPGETVAFVGESGSGKSTLMSLLIGFWRPSSGSILLDGVDNNTIDLRTWRKHIAVVPQNTILFSGTIRDNVLYGKSNVSEDSLNRAIEAANLNTFIDSLPKGLDTFISENGKDLSGGQRQRISIARAIIRDPQIIILDEATSALDTVSEKEVQDAIDNLIKGRTTFIVAHRLSTIRNADRIYVMKEGRCIESGTQEELLRLNGEFSRLKSLQI